MIENSQRQSQTPTCQAEALMIARSLMVVALLVLPRLVWATDYRFCVVCDNRTSQVVATSGPIDYGLEWYRVKTAEKVAQAYGSRSCGANDYDPNVCGSLPE